MFNVISKFFVGFFDPFLLFFLVLLYIYLKNVGKVKFLSGLTAIIFCILVGNYPLANFSAKLYCSPPVNLNSTTKYTVIILGGLTNQVIEPTERVHTNQAADRLLQILPLYRNGIISRYIVTGGKATQTPTNKTEAGEMFKLLTLCGVDSNIILREDSALNTYQNALFVKQLLQKNSELTNNNLLLVTSAYHMPRALACFKKVGLSVTPYPTDFRFTNQKNFALTDVLPTYKALAIWDLLIHEWIGLATYKIKGYI